MAYATGSGGYLTAAKPRPSLATAIQDPFGLRPDNRAVGPRSNPLTQLTQPARSTYTPPAASAPTVVKLPPPQITAPTPQAPIAPAGVYDINTDPALQQAYNYAGRSNADAQAQALKDKTQLVEQAGIPTLAQSLGLGADVASVASGNPFSTAANLKHTLDVNTHDLQTQNTQNAKSLTDQLNAANLIYGGYGQTQRKQLADAFGEAAGEQTRGYQQGLSDLGTAVQGQADQIASALAQTLGANQQQVAQTQQAARDRAVQLALSSGMVFTGYDADGNPTFSAAPAITTTPTTTTAPATAPAGPGQNLTIAQALGQYGPTPQQRVRFIGF